MGPSPSNAGIAALREQRLDVTNADQLVVPASAVHPDGDVLRSALEVEDRPPRVLEQPTTRLVARGSGTALARIAN